MLDKYSKLPGKSKTKKESLRNYQSQEELKETWLLNVMWYPRCDPGTEKGHK